MTKKIILYQICGFGGVILLLWASEVLDIPYYLLGAAATPVNWTESMFETFFVFTLGLLVILLSRRFLKRIKYLEGFLAVCSFCKRIRVDQAWIPMEMYISEHSEAKFSHGLCPDCLRRHYGES